jgi:hypothetical protein
MGRTVLPPRARLMACRGCRLAMVVASFTGGAVDNRGVFIHNPWLLMYCESIHGLLMFIELYDTP